jgi:peptidoglycan/LPS O-acetylase OafA/YrhL
VGADTLKRILELDGLRAMLALWVVLVHVSKAVFDVGELPLAGIIYDEKTRVKVFFMISGMVVFGMLKTKDMPFWMYMTGRIRRIYPAYFAAIILSLITIPITAYALQNIPFDVPQNVARTKILTSTVEYLPAHILAHLSMLHGVVPTICLYSNYWAGVEYIDGISVLSDSAGLGFADTTAEEGNRARLGGDPGRRGGRTAIPESCYAGARRGLFCCRYRIVLRSGAIRRNF